MELKMEHELEDVERDYIEFRKEIGEEKQERVDSVFENRSIT
jgi:hypothetical protein